MVQQQHTLAASADARSFTSACGQYFASAETAALLMAQENETRLAISKTVQLTMFNTTRDEMQRAVLAWGETPLLRLQSPLI
eukprot:GDKH01022541.1.p1 GENE.GDKH01022541.1~~GDKH01022541.1.p1  ORF type:complete len:82 (-),score=9.44 GDKH01022541.1:208-453(-)